VIHVRTSEPTPLVPRPRRGPRADAGFTLIEVLVSALLVVFIAAAASKALITTSHTSADQRLRSQADGLATQDQERLRGLSDDQLLNLTQSRTSTVNGTAFTVQSTSTWEDTSGATSCHSTAAAYYHIVSTVSWNEGFSNQSASIQEDSLLSRPVAGDLLTQVTDQTGAALNGVSVSTTGPATSSSAGPLAQTGQTDANGCIMFAGLTPPGLYTVGLSYNGWVDPSGNAAPTGTATVTSTGLAVQPNNGVFHLGQPGSIVGTFKTAATGGSTGEADGISWMGSKGSIPMPNFETAPTSKPSTLGTGYTTGALFPFASVSPTSYTSNYTVWAGRCAGQAPPAPNPDQFTVSPGSTGTAQTIQEPLLDMGNISYKSSSGATAQTKAPAHVTLAFNDGTCSDTWTPTLASSILTTGWFQNPGQPYAPTNDLTVCADFNTGTTSRPVYWKNTVTTSNTSFTGTNTIPTITITKGVTSTGSSSGAC
jgi:prepilin-type N-terminal cleavage/methylation domain-containing protein